jgi:hypothetical protein
MDIQRKHWHQDVQMEARVRTVKARATLEASKIMLHRPTVEGKDLPFLTIRKAEFERDKRYKTELRVVGQVVKSEVTGDLALRAINKHRGWPTIELGYLPAGTDSEALLGKQLVVRAFLWEIKVPGKGYRSYLRVRSMRPATQKDLTAAMDAPAEAKPPARKKSSGGLRF